MSLKPEVLAYLINTNDFYRYKILERDSRFETSSQERIHLKSVESLALVCLWWQWYVVPARRTQEVLHSAVTIASITFRQPQMTRLASTNAINTHNYINKIDIKPILCWGPGYSTGTWSNAQLNRCSQQHKQEM